MTKLSPLPSGLEAVFLELRPALIQRALAMGAGADAEDVLQDVWLRMRAVKTPIAQPRAYLYRMVYTVVLDRRRQARRAATRDGAWIRDQDVDAPRASPTPERSLLAREALQAVETRLAILGEPAATILRRHRLGGEAQKAIAADLGMGLSTVEKHLRRAYAALLDVSEDEA